MLGSFCEITDKQGYVFDFDRRIHALAGLDIEYDEYFDKDGTRPDAFNRAFDKLREIEAAQNKAGGVCPFGFVGVDSYTFMQYPVMRKAYPEVTKVLKPVRVSDDKDRFKVPAQGDYQAYMYLMNEFLTKLCSLNCHIIVTALEKEELINPQTKQAGRAKVNAFGQMGNQLPGYFNEVWRMQLDNEVKDNQRVTKYSVVTRPDNLRSARTCYKDALAASEPASVKHIYDKIIASLKSKHPEAYKEATLKALAT